MLLAFLLFWARDGIRELTAFAIARPSPIGWQTLDGRREVVNGWANRDLAGIIYTAAVWESHPIDEDLRAAVSHHAEDGVVHPRWWGILGKAAQADREVALRARMDQRWRWAAQRLGWLGDTTACLLCVARDALPLGPSPREQALLREALAIRTGAVAIIAALGEPRVGASTIEARQREAVQLNLRYQRMATEWQALWLPREATRREMIATVQRLGQVDLMVDAAECRRLRKRCDLLKESAVVIAGRLKRDPEP